MKNLRKIYKKYEEIINYVIAGCLTTVVSLASYYICVVIFLNPNNPLQLQMANIISWILSVTFAYFANRRYVFKSKNTNKLKEASKFYLSRISTLIIDISSMFVLVTTLGLNDKVSKLFVQFLIVIFNYIFSKTFVFIRDE